MGVGRSFSARNVTSGKSVLSLGCLELERTNKPPAFDAFLRMRGYVRTPLNSAFPTLQKAQ